MGKSVEQPQVIELQTPVNMVAAGQPGSDNSKLPTAKELLWMRNQLPDYDHMTGASPVNRRAESLLGKFDGIAPSAAQVIGTLAPKMITYNPDTGNAAPDNSAIKNASSSYPERRLADGEYSYDIVNPVKRINDIYKDDGGFTGVMASKMSKNPDYKANSDLAWNLYNLGAARQRIYSTGNYPYDYNSEMEKGVGFNIPVLTETRYDTERDKNRDYSGMYDSEDKLIRVVQRGLNNPAVRNNTALGQDDNTTINHELVHSVQDRNGGISRTLRRYVGEDWWEGGDENMPKSLKPTTYGGVNDDDHYASGGYENVAYLLSPWELQARAASVNQSFKQQTGKSLSAPEDIDKFVNSIVDNYDYLEKIDETLGENQKANTSGSTMEQQGRKHYLDQLNANDDFMKKFGISAEAIMSAYEILSPFAVTGDITNKDGKIDKAKAAKYLKALIMTTAKNNQQIPQQPNGVFDNGFNIS